MSVDVDIDTGHRRSLSRSVLMPERDRHGRDLNRRDASRAQIAAIITVCAMAATLMQALDTTIANVALPYMQGIACRRRSDQITWVLTSYIVAAAIMTAPVGWLSARFGRKHLFLDLPRRLHRRLDAVRRWRSR